MTPAFRLCDDYVRQRAALDPVMASEAGLRAGLAEGLRRGLPAARRQAIETAAQASRYAAARTHDDLIAECSSAGSLAGELAAAAASAYQGYAELARWLREDYAPRASEADAVGPERYAVEARLHLGADVDLHEAYEYGWAELRRIEAEMAAEASRVSPGATLDEAAAILDDSAYVTGPDAYRAWLRDHHDQAISLLHGAVFDIPEPLQTLDVVLSPSSTSGAPYYTPPSEDFARPGRTWWPLGGRERFTVWRELTSVYHEGVPGHHLQIGTVLMAGDRLSRFARCTHVFAHSEGWALYAERLADELGWYTEPGTRLGMLQAAALRAARVVIDIGLHLDLPLPDGSRWNFAKACEVLRDHGQAEPHRVHPEIVRYCAWPAQAITFKLGERAWLAARDEAARRDGFDVRRWHASALALGPVGLAGMAGMLRKLPMEEP